MHIGGIVTGILVSAAVAGIWFGTLRSRPAKAQSAAPPVDHHIKYIQQSLWRAKVCLPPLMRTEAWSHVRTVDHGEGYRDVFYEAKLEAATYGACIRTLSVDGTVLKAAIYSSAQG